MQKADPAVRNVALRCLGQAALVDVDFAKRHMLLFLQVRPAYQLAFFAFF
jgi:hypothetical protein